MNFSEYARRLRTARSSTPKVMNNTMVRWASDAQDRVIIRHFHTDLFSVDYQNTVTILCAYNSVSSKRRFSALAGIYLFRPFRGLELAFRHGGIVPCPARPGTVYRPNDNRSVLANARYWLEQLPTARSGFARQMRVVVDRWEAPYVMADGQESGLCLVNKFTGCYERLLTEEDRYMKLKGQPVDIGYQVTIDGVEYYIEPAEDYARGGRL